MDDTLDSEAPVHRPGGSQEAGKALYGISRLESGALDTRNLLDESLDLQDVGATDASMTDGDVHASKAPAHSTFIPEPHHRAKGSHSEAQLSGSVQQLRDVRCTAEDSALASGAVKANDIGTSNSDAQAPEPNHDELPTEPPLSSEERRRAALLRERQELATMNTLLEQAIASIEQGIPSIQRFQNTIGTTHNLLDTYARVLGQADHTATLLLDETWEPERDELEMREAVAAEEQRQREEEERMAQEQREAEEFEIRQREEAERKKLMAGTSQGRGRGQTRGATGTGSRGRASALQRGSTTRGSTRGRPTGIARGSTRS